MRKTFTTPLLCFLVLLASLSTPLTVHAGGEPGYPLELRISEGDEAHVLTLSGHAERVFLFFKVYDIAHYVQAANERSPAPGSIVQDGPAKALVITFARTLSRERIRQELDKSLRRNAQPGWLQQADSTIAAFMSAIDRDALKGDQLVFHWLSGGRIFAQFNGEAAFSATDTAFAKLIWSIWFGDKPACNRDDLLASLTAADGL